MSDDMCLDAASPQGPVKMVRCHGMGGNQAWTYDDEVKTHYLYSKITSNRLFFVIKIFTIFQARMIKHINTKYCLAKPRHNDATQPILAQCDLKATGQKWIMQSKFKWQAS